jgi:hypothetical protein
MSSSGYWMVISWSLPPNVYRDLPDTRSIRMHNHKLFIVRSCLCVGITEVEIQNDRPVGSQAIQRRAP